MEENPDPSTRPNVVRVVTKDGSSFDIYRPVVARDTLKGWADEKLTRPVAVATSSIANAETQRLNGARTAILVTGLVAGAIVAVYAILLASFLEAVE